MFDCSRIHRSCTGVKASVGFKGGYHFKAGFNSRTGSMNTSTGSEPKPIVNFSLTIQPVKRKPNRKNKKASNWHTLSLPVPNNEKMYCSLSDTYKQCCRFGYEIFLARLDLDPEKLFRIFPF